MPAPSPAGPVKPPVPNVDEPALSALPLPLLACPDCGALGMRALRMDEGGIPSVSELLDHQACPRCRYQGLAVEFARREDYASYVRRLNLTWNARPDARR